MRHILSSLFQSLKNIFRDNYVLSKCLTDKVFECDFIKFSYPIAHCSTLANCTTIVQMILDRHINGILLPKLFWPTVRKNCSSDWEKLLKFEAKDPEFAKILRSLKQNINTLSKATLVLSQIFAYWKRLSDLHLAKTCNTYLCSKNTFLDSFDHSLSLRTTWSAKSFT